MRAKPAGSATHGSGPAAGAVRGTGSKRTRSAKRDATCQGTACAGGRNPRFLPIFHVPRPAGLPGFGIDALCPAMPIERFEVFAARIQHMRTGGFRSALVIALGDQLGDHDMVSRILDQIVHRRQIAQPQ